MSARADEHAGQRGSSGLSEDERSQIAERLRWSPMERLQYLLDMLAFEELARRARRADSR
jgi:hypothetical protein